MIFSVTEPNEEEGAWLELYSDYNLAILLARHRQYIVLIERNLV